MAARPANIASFPADPCRDSPRLAAPRGPRLTLGGGALRRSRGKSVTTTYPNIIDGARDDAGAGFDVINPSTGDIAGRAIGADAATLARAVAAARQG